jgi:DNA-binding winged helix-turn-helix (wHTH) protein/tetratricopeptide (TPR) repeat protein
MSGRAELFIMKPDARLDTQPGGAGRGLDSESAPAAVYRVGDLLVDVGRGRVVRADREIPLPKLSFDLLLALIRAAPNLVRLDMLMERVWPGLVVSPETVTQRVKVLRDSLGDDPKNPRYVGGVRGRGYRLVAEVIALPAAPTSPELKPTSEPIPTTSRASAWRWVGVGAGVLALAAGLVAGLGYFRSNSSLRPAALNAAAMFLAIAPFEDGGTGRGAALEEQIRERVSALPGITMVPIVRDGASRGLTLSGLLQDHADGTSVSVRIDGDGVRDLWHQTVVVKLPETSQLVDVVAGAVQDISRVRVHEVEIAAPDYTTLQLYLIARSALRDRPPHFATQLRAIADDLIRRSPKFAPGHAIQALGCTFDAIEHAALQADEEADLACARAAVERSLQLNPQLAEAHAAAGFLAATEADLCHGAQCALTRYRESAQMSLEQAIRLDPQLLEARIWLTRVFSTRGELARSMEQSQAALRLDPLSPIATINFAYELMDRARHDEAKALLEPLAKRSYANPQVTLWLAQNAFLAGRHDEELAWIDASLKLRTGERMWNINRYIVLSAAESFARNRRPAQARAVLLDLPDVATPDDMNMVMVRVWAWTWLGESAQIAPYLQSQQQTLIASMGGVANAYDRGTQQAHAMGFTLIGQPQSVIRLLEPLFGTAGRPHIDPTESALELTGLQCLAWAYRETGDRERAHAMAMASLDLLAKLQAQGVDNSNYALVRALGYALADRIDEAHSELQRAAALGWSTAAQVTLDPRWSHALEHPGIRELVRG